MKSILLLTVTVYLKIKNDFQIGFNQRVHVVAFIYMLTSIK